MIGLAGPVAEWLCRRLPLSDFGSVGISKRDRELIGAYCEQDIRDCVRLLAGMRYQLTAAAQRVGRDLQEQLHWPPP